MRKVFLAELALVAFATLPAVASAAPAELRDEEGNDPGSIVLRSSNLTVTFVSTVTACAEAEIRATRRGVGRYGGRESRFEGGGNPATHCRVLAFPPERVSSRIRPLRYRGGLNFRDVNGTTRFQTRLDLEIGFRDLTLGGLFRECKLETTLEGMMVGDAVTLDANTSLILTEDRFSTGCPTTVALNGEFEVTDREGGEVTAH